jgi:hypothetical protein
MEDMVRDTRKQIQAMMTTDRTPSVMTLLVCGRAPEPLGYLTGHELVRTQQTHENRH